MTVSRSAKGSGPMGARGARAPPVPAEPTILQDDEWKAVSDFRSRVSGRRRAWAWRETQNPWGCGVADFDIIFGGIQEIPRRRQGVETGDGYAFRSDGLTGRKRRRGG